MGSKQPQRSPGRKPAGLPASAPSPLRQLYGPVRHKYKAQPTTHDGIRFDSKAEANYYAQLKLRKQAGEIVQFLRQVPLHLPGGTKLVVDFLEFHADGSVHFVDVKGVQTEQFKAKKRIAEQLYAPITIKTVGDPFK